jgi:peptide/nickel transport system permease protein
MRQEADRRTGELLLEVRDLRIEIPAHYGSVAVVEDVSFTMTKGETLGLVGESGSGKTLIGRALLGALPYGAVPSGQVRVAGVDMLTGAPSEISRLHGAVVAAVFQDALVSLSPTRAVRGHFDDVWAGSGRPRAEVADAAIEALELAALPSPRRVLASYPHELSGGMRQRVLMALALLRRPSLLIADEPTTALDRVIEADVLSTLENLQKDLGLAVLLISHDFDVIGRMCRRVAVLYGGQLCELGPTDEVMARPLHPYTAGLLDSVRSLAERRRPLSSISGTVPTPAGFPPGCRFATRCGRAAPECATPRPSVAVESVAWCHRPLRPAVAKEASTSSGGSHG